MTTHQHAASTSSTVQLDPKKARFFRIYLSTLAALGVGVCVASAVLGWGFWGWFGGVFLLVAGGGGLAGMAKTGGPGQLACPICTKPIEVMQINVDRTMQCPHCDTYLEGSTQMQRVPDDRIATHTAFETPLRDNFVWPKECPVCAGPVTGTVTVEGMSTAGAVALVAAPIAVARVTKVEAPCCDQHKDGVSLRREGSNTIIAFRSIHYWREFRALNGA
ncbi:MAG: hypothetical protein HOW73_09885 [Polyangiaceae bacterium]|nr:hypothetical protein [Polyangiaceae bacterium]